MPSTPNLRYRGIIFDLDGTLINSLDDLHVALNQALAAMGHPAVTRAQTAAMVGDGARMLVRRALGPADESCVEPVLRAFGRYYAEHFADQTGLYPGIARLLDELTAGGIRLAILSNKPQPFTEQCAAALLSRWPFDPIVGAEAQYPRKPDPTAARAIADDWSMTAVEVVLVGDSTADITTARAAGMTAVAVSWGFRSSSQLASANPDRIVDSPAELMAALRTGARD